MESKKRLSLDGTNSGSGPSALRRLTRSPSHRISLRRSSTESTSSSSVSSIASEDNEASLKSCVTRGTSSDDCALHRFIVWTAVKRNECDRMTPQEKLECPMLRCRKRFANHELMLQHLYSCSWLSSSEYWCYECGKSERFNDSKCKRCLGHPSRRKKILSMAKSFFNSLGHKPKSSALEDLDLDSDIGESEAPPSYDLAVAPSELELPTNEIHEIGSSGIVLQPILENENENENEAEISPAPMLTPYISSLPTQTQAQTLPAHPAELESDATISDPLDFMLPPGTVVPVNLIDPGCNTTSVRPTLQLHTAGLEEYRREQKRRSKGQVAPSTSVRSTASTNSTSSTNTTDTTFSRESYNISPISSFSDQWASAPVFNSDFTSPENGFGSPGGLLRTNSFAISHKAPAAKGWNSLENEAGMSYDSQPTELPANIHMLGALPATKPDTLNLNQPVFALNDSFLSSTFDLDANIALIDNNVTMPPSLHPMPPQPKAESYHNPRSLIGTAWSTLQMHVADSLTKLHHITKNHLVIQLRSLTAPVIATKGLETLMDIIEGRQPTVPINVLCFVHLVYCFSLIVHEQDAAKRSSDLFVQAMSYSALFSRQDRQLYIQIVETLWKPADMSNADLVNLVRAKTSLMSHSPGSKGKGIESRNMMYASVDSLAFLAMYFLDQLENATIHVTDDTEVLSSDLFLGHCNSLDRTHMDPTQTMAANLILKHNFQLYTHYQAFANNLNNIARRANSELMLPRRLELELMECGKMYLPPDIYFDSYIRFVREQMDSIYCTATAEGSYRALYYRQCIELIKTVIGVPLQPMAEHAAENSSVTQDGFDDIDEFFNVMSPNNFNFSSVGPFDAGQPLDFSCLPNTIDPGTLNPLPLPTPADTNSVQATSTAANSPPSPAPAAKTKSDSSCKLCGYTPEGDPRWFSGSMAKHIKLQHSTKPPTIYRCPYPGCTSQYKNRPDNLRQHQIEKGHFLEGQDVVKRSNKRRKIE
ncbi:hypothetical protein FOXG_06311 [Fusarium oxysporum f. sp. lycopersici 4287]|uniref:Uncharacterized protein n=5 Tax=Fusarium oxysporum TaxID=5507 RepID=A0A0J9WLM5_FUSO4|nr:hypothetical protein FOXG_06311 [Fusarium oxysporum f. sp. lycopersici 4287]XP_018242088.1 hypothetical protein FOXG_06311 [Fusarium oxysporum f. sp. lycopersici 4287]EXK35403.1 hypothetical protein FOMG_10541 [Fusarium oxysporum f. sp. melonis 26406]EXK35404.1 hypothetical protein FOMG_10541 [Fusarium oxysporum f. sp. melonis 26406]KNB04042.1 hypothetical protein FOXG_06311 [Fusarium oxysporum f. sp. lycopersici 4287]KNB04043.1 hypothetical protein FOXG_06311 [Fusarium oxysporum f. sp. lyc